MLSNNKQSLVLKKVKITPKQAVKAYRVMKRKGDHTVYTFGSKMAMRLSALHIARALLPRNIIFLFLVLISVRG
jgi:hypothetical protein